MIISEEISGRLEDFRAVCSEHGVGYLYAFCSSVTDEFNSENSDIDD